MQIGKDKVVTVDYTLKDDQGQVLDTSEGRGPLDYLHGVGGIVPGLERALEGHAAGDAVHVKVEPHEAYGARDESLVQPVPRAAFPPGQQINPGMQFQANAGGQTRIVTVVGVDNDQVRVDANHPLAGKNLNFDVTVRDVRDATPEELQHGHVHGPGGHHHH